MTYSRPLLALPVLLAGLAACARPQPANEPLNDPALAAKMAAAAKGPKAPPGHLLRDEVDQVLTQIGPAWVFRRVMREEVIKKDGKFAGWRVTGLPEEWTGIDLRPGDVVTRINGLALETPDAAWDAWKSVAKYPALKVSITRDGTNRELTIPIDGSPSAKTVERLEHPQAARAEAPEKKGVTIGGSGSDGADEETY